MISFEIRRLPRRTKSMKSKSMKTLLLICLFEIGTIVHGTGEHTKTTQGVRGGRMLGIESYILFESIHSKSSFVEQTGKDSDPKGVETEDEDPPKLGVKVKVDLTEIKSSTIATMNDDTLITDFPLFTHKDKAIDNHNDTVLLSKKSSSSKSGCSSSGSRSQEGKGRTNHTEKSHSTDCESPSSVGRSKGVQSSKLNLSMSKKGSKYHSPQVVKKKKKSPVSRQSKGGSMSKQASTSKVQKSKKRMEPPKPLLPPDNAVYLAPYSILYSLDISRIPLDTEVEEVGDVTDMYLDEYFKKLYPALDEFKLEIAGQTLVSPVEPYLINYTSSVHFKRDAPPASELELRLAQAFTNDGKIEYIDVLQRRLEQESIFSTTDDIFFILDTSETGTVDDFNGPVASEPDNDEQQSLAKVVGAAAAATVAVALLVVGSVFYVGGNQCKDQNDDFEKPQINVADTYSDAQSQGETARLTTIGSQDTVTSLHSGSDQYTSNSIPIRYTEIQSDGGRSLMQTDEDASSECSLDDCLPEDFDFEKEAEQQERSEWDATATLLYPTQGLNETIRQSLTSTAPESQQNYDNDESDAKGIADLIKMFSRS